MNTTFFRVAWDRWINAADVEEVRLWERKDASGRDELYVTLLKRSGKSWEAHGCYAEEISSVLDNGARTAVPAPPGYKLLSAFDDPTDATEPVGVTAAPIVAFAIDCGRESLLHAVADTGERSGQGTDAIERPDGTVILWDDSTTWPSRADYVAYLREAFERSRAEVPTPAGA
jgi:hypothetical protein